MKKTLRKLRVATLLILLLEILVMGGLILAYYVDFLGIRSLLNIMVIVGFAAFIMIVNLVFMLTFLAVMLRER